MLSRPDMSNPVLSRDTQKIINFLAQKNFHYGRTVIRKGKNNERTNVSR